RGETSRTDRAVVKVLKSGVAESLNEELMALESAADFLDATRESSGLAATSFRETNDDVRRLLTHEVDLANEQKNLRAARQLFGVRRDVIVPEVLLFSTADAIGMERVAGTKVTELPYGDRRRRPLAFAVVRALIADVLFSDGDQALFHGDPHAGNLFATEDG